MVTLTRRSALAVGLFLLVLLFPRGVSAQGAQEATSLRVGGPARLELGERATVQAVLDDSAGNPISKATIYFSVPASFLSGSGDMVVAQAVTNDKGQAVAEFGNQLEGPLTLRAEFRGDQQYAPSDATTQINVTGNGQVYVQQVGIQIPGLNQPPPMPAAAYTDRPRMGAMPDVSPLWPTMSGWPIALVLMTVWALYVFAVGLVFRIAASAPQARGGYNPLTGRFE